MPILRSHTPTRRPASLFAHAQDWAKCALLFVLASTLSGLDPSSALAQWPAPCDPDCGPARCWWPFHGAALHGRPCWNLEAYGQQAASTITQGLQAQVQNGAAIELTLWNHHFEEGATEESADRGPPTAKLHPSGLALLHRAARRYANQPGLFVLVQTAHDVPFASDKLDGYAAEVSQLDAARVDAVKAYFAKVLRRPDARVFVHDPPLVGMPADEMKAAYANMVKYGPRSVLETVDPEIRPAGSYAAPPGFVNTPSGLVPIQSPMAGQP